jgi:hypothetical protein
MQRFLASVVLGVFLVLGSGCAAFSGDVRSDKVATTPQQITQKSIDNANAAIAAADKTLVLQVKAGAIPFDQGKAAHDKLNSAAAYVELAEGMMKNGDWNDAATQLKIGNGLLTVVQSYLIKASQEGK